MSVERDDAVLRVAKSLCPYGWDNGYWQAPDRAGHFDRNQKHVQGVALRQAERAVSLLEHLGVLHWEKVIK